MPAFPYIMLLGLTTLLAVALAAYVWRRRVPSGLALAWLALSIAVTRNRKCYAIVMILIELDA